MSEDLPYIQLRGKIIKFEEKGKLKSKRLIAHFQDDTGIIELVWFKGARWIKSGVKLNSDYIVFGKPSSFNNKFNIVHPELDLLDTNINFSPGLQAVYNSTELLNAKGLSSRAISKLVIALLPQIKNNLDENLSPDLIAKLNLPSREKAFNDIHCPKDSKMLVLSLIHISEPRD